MLRFTFSLLLHRLRIQIIFAFAIPLNCYINFVNSRRAMLNKAAHENHGFYPAKKLRSEETVKSLANLEIIKRISSLVN